MSAKDRAFVDKNISNMEAIKAYFEAKGKSVPDWVKRQEKNFWNSQPKWDWAIVCARGIRKSLEEGKGGKDLESLFEKLIPLIEIMQTLPLVDTAITADSKRRANLYWWKLWAQIDDLNRKYKLNLHLDLTGDIEKLEPWEKVIPKR